MNSKWPKGWLKFTRDDGNDKISANSIGTDNLVARELVMDILKDKT
jgi:hypothetical protein